jgi:hypothetical protein
MKTADAQVSTSDSCWRLVSLGLLAANLIWSAVLEAGIFQSTGKLQSILTGFEAKQGWLTTLVLSSWFLWFLPTLALVALIKEWTVDCPRSRLSLNFVHLFLILVLQAVYVIGIFSPVFDLLNRLAD